LQNSKTLLAKKMQTRTGLGDFVTSGHSEEGTLMNPMQEQVYMRTCSRTYVVACDGSVDSVLAVQRAAELASPFQNDQVVLVTVPCHHGHVLFSRKDTPEDHAVAQKLLGDMRNVFEKTNSCIVRTHVLDSGDPRLKIVKFAAECNADYLLAGMHGLSKPSGPIGSVGGYILNHSAMPTIILRTIPQPLVEGSSLF
jgi:nucleotide-binding universal stress UspA family protein